MRTFDRVVDHALNEMAGRDWVPAVDVAERRDSYVILVELPGVNQDNVDVHFEQNILTVSGSKQPSFDANTAGDVRFFAAERTQGDFARSVRLPDAADAERIEASFANGLLTITVPKARAAQPRKISINTSDATTRRSNEVQNPAE